MGRVLEGLAHRYLQCYFCETWIRHELLLRIGPFREGIYCAGCYYHICEMGDIRDGTVSLGRKTNLPTGEVVDYG